MKGLELRPSAGIRQITLAIEPLLLDGPIDEKAIFQFINASNYSGFFQLDDNIVDLSTQLQNAFANNEMSPLEGIVAEARDADVLVSIASDQMSAELTLIAPYMGDTPSLDEIKGILAEQSVVRGVSSKIIKRMLSQLLDTEPGQSIVHLVAKGLPPKPGKNSYMKNIVVNALQRMLVPKESDDQINMRDFGDILCVSPDEILAKRMPPTKGRDGYTVGAKPLCQVSGRVLYWEITLISTLATMMLSVQKLQACLASSNRLCRSVIRFYPKVLTLPQAISNLKALSLLKAT